jgi:MFS family permease
VASCYSLLKGRTMSATVQHGAEDGKPAMEHRELYGKADPTFDDIKHTNEQETQNELATVLQQEKPSTLTSSLLCLSSTCTDPWAPHMMKLYLILIPAYLCSTTNGFDSNTFGGASALPQFIKYFNLAEGNTQGLLASMYVLGSMLAAFFSGQIADTFGRRWGMAVGSAIACVGAALQVAASGGSMLIAGRVILGVGAVIGQTAAPAYVVEFSHPAYRAVLTGLYNTMFFVSLHCHLRPSRLTLGSQSGTIVSTFILYGLSYVPNNPKFAWQVPMALQALPSVFVLAFVWAIPESPRWHMGQGNEAKAREILIKYHGGGNPDSAIVRLEMSEMKSAIQVENGADKRSVLLLLSCA